MSFFRGASGITVLGGTQIAVGAGSTVNVNQGSQAAFKDLSAAVAHTALHDSAARFNAPRCHRNTRAKYRNQLEQWMLGQEEFEGKQLIWLHGGAGAGKSAIMQSVVEQCAQHGSVLGSFFFFRADPSRNYAEVLIPTLAYQVASAFPQAMAILEGVITRNPLIFKASLHTQAIELLVRPLRCLFEDGTLDSTSPLRRVFVVDGLDECSDPQKQTLIIQVIASILCNHHLPICFLIASRPEIAISSAFARETRLHGRFSTITLDDDDDAKADIRQFIEDSFLDILDNHPWRMNIELPWPNPKSIDDIVWKSSGHFIYAATVMRFIASLDEHPGRALKVVQMLEPSRTGSPFAELDSLYLHILTSAKYSTQVLEILRHCYFSSFLSRSVAGICWVYNIAPQDVSLFLSDVQSLVSLVPSDRGQLFVVPKHASLGGFLTDIGRSQGLYIDSRAYLASLLPRYFQILDEGPYISTFPFDLSIQSYDTSALLGSLYDAIQYSECTDLLRSLIAGHSSYDIWNFCIKCFALDTDKASSRHGIRDTTVLFTYLYMDKIYPTILSFGYELYLHQFQMYIELLLDHIQDLIRMKKPQYRIIPALILSSDHYNQPRLVDDLLYLWRRQFRILSVYRFHFRLFWNKRVDPWILAAMRPFQASLGSDLAVFMKLVLQQLMQISWSGPLKTLYTSPHRQRLHQYKGARHTSLGVALMIHNKKSRDEESDSWKPAHPFLLSCWHRLLPQKRVNINWQRQKCCVLLDAVIFYLHKSDCTGDVVRLARRSLPMAALWFPKLMKEARAEMDAYVCRWEESLEMHSDDMY